MKISYISDIHLDWHVPFVKNQTKWEERSRAFIRKLIKTDKTNRDVLIVAGDLSHSNRQSFWIVDEFARMYEQVYICLGNHDYYLTSETQAANYRNHSLNRLNELLGLLEHFTNVKVLIGFEKHQITETISIAGDTFWYPIESLEQISFFHNISNDSKYIKGLNIGLEHNYTMTNYEHLDTATIIVTHIPPIILNSHVQYNSTACYLNPVHELKAQHWICGHCHEQAVYSKTYGTFYINAIGYNDEFKVWHPTNELYNSKTWDDAYYSWYSIKHFDV